MGSSGYLGCVHEILGSWKNPTGSRYVYSCNVLWLEKENSLEKLTSNLVLSNQKSFCLTFSLFLILDALSMELTQVLVHKNRSSAHLLCHRLHISVQPVALSFGIRLGHERGALQTIIIICLTEEEHRHGYNDGGHNDNKYNNSNGNYHTNKSQFLLSHKLSEDSITTQTCIIIIIINPLTARIVGASQMICKD